MLESHRTAFAKSREEGEALIEEDRSLLEHFGLTIISIEDGIKAAETHLVNKGRVLPWNVIRLDNRAWSWLKPVLARFRDMTQDEP